MLNTASLKSRPSSATVGIDSTRRRNDPPDGQTSVLLRIPIRTNPGSRIYPAFPVYPGPLGVPEVLGFTRGPRVHLGSASSCSHRIKANPTSRAAIAAELSSTRYVVMCHGSGPHQPADRQIGAKGKPLASASVLKNKVAPARPLPASQASQVNNQTPERGSGESCV